MEIAESVAQRFLTANGAGEGAVFVLPQYELRDPLIPKWGASIDFVALYFLPDGRSRILMVEVCDGGGLGSVATKAALFESDGYRERLAQQVARQTNGMIDDWEVVFLGFVATSALAAKARSQFRSSHMHFWALTDAFANGWWEKRMAGLLQEPQGD